MRTGQIIIASPDQARASIRAATAKLEKEQAEFDQVDAAVKAVEAEAAALEAAIEEKQAQAPALAQSFAASVLGDDKPEAEAAALAQWQLAEAAAKVYEHRLAEVEADLAGKHRPTRERKRKELNKVSADHLQTRIMYEKIANSDQ